MKWCRPDMKIKNLRRSRRGQEQIVPECICVNGVIGIIMVVKTTGAFIHFIRHEINGNSVFL